MRIRSEFWDFPGDAVDKTLGSQCRGPELHSWAWELDPTYMPQPRVRMPQPRIHLPQLRSLGATTKEATCYN